MNGEQAFERLLTFQFDPTRANAREHLDFDISIGKEFHFPSLAWNNDFYSHRLWPKVPERIVELCLLKALEEVQ